DYTHGERAYFYDVDGNRYLDFWMGHYANILGHSPVCVREKLAEKLAQGAWHSGIVCRDEVRLAELVCRLVPSAEMVRFCCSGTESSMYGLRLARSYTGREIVMKVSGGWHGAGADLLVSVSRPYEKSESAGLLAASTDKIVSVPFNDPAAAEKLIRKYGDRLAAVIIEPMVGVGGFIMADREYLEVIRKASRQAGAVLIFDEIISGFRLGLGGAQEIAGVLPDLTLLGKVLGGGMPLGAVCGRRDIMKLADPATADRAEGKYTVTGGGTFSCHPLAMAAGIAMLEQLIAREAEIYPKLARAGDYLRQGIEEVFADHDIWMECTGFASLFMPHFPLGKRGGEQRVVKSPADAAYKTDVHKREIILKEKLLQKGIYVMHGGGAVSDAHTKEDLDSLLQALESIAPEIKCQPKTDW
ncbi:MAG: aspartate aminotransferase family protein, partial [bacterium]